MKIKQTSPFEKKERNVEITLAILNGATLRSQHHKHNLATPRVRKILMNECLKMGLYKEDDCGKGLPGFGTSEPGVAYLRKAFKSDARNKKRERVKQLTDLAERVGKRAAYLTDGEITITIRLHPEIIEWLKHIISKPINCGIPEHEDTVDYIHRRLLIEALN